MASYTAAAIVDMDGRQYKATEIKCGTSWGTSMMSDCMYLTNQLLTVYHGGEGGIRTHDTLPYT